MRKYTVVSFLSLTLPSLFFLPLLYSPLPLPVVVLFFLCVWCTNVCYAVPVCWDQDRLRRLSLLLLQCSLHTLSGQQALGSTHLSPTSPQSCRSE